MSRRRKIIVLCAAALLAYPGVTYVQALTYPGNAPWGVRTVDWLRDMGGGQVVNAVENWWYTRHQPPNTAPPPDSLPGTAPAGQQAVPGTHPGAVGVTGIPLPGEGVWVPGARLPDGAAADYTTFVRPDPQHAAVVAGVAWLNQSLVRTTLIAGTKEPRGAAGPEGAAVPGSLRRSLLATFNSGFKMRDCACGVYLDGVQGPSLREGAASAVVHVNGRVTVDQWGRDAALGPDVVAVRQNLDLVVDNGKPVTGLWQNPAGQWGSASNQFQYTWRSGLGVDRAGNLIYVAGDKLTLTTLAQALVQAGVVRGMELDIHAQMVSFNSYRPDLPGIPPQHLLPSMQGSPDRYLAADQRDFFAVTLAAAGQSARSR
ncbi:phosphodiester glycosidase family protein [Amycolatopsis sp.]|uniref:phosphodiester glycosidase family protein n=1 Tax=Amycolatopsis sp. TaxID=37632 RepID=UPI002CB5F901|nr:phosphodiester glycosidase family protein [Amycolatopsis sp.]HVV12263.1 phosphodiester glycosidase family protein [Amycolatopsis sp.]